MEASPEKISSSSSSSSSPLNEDRKGSTFSFNDTELRLGLPGSERNSGNGVSLFGKDLEDKQLNGFSSSSLCHLKNLVSGSKRGFSDAIDGKWGFSMNNGSEVKLSEGNCLQTVKEAVSVPESLKISQEKKPLVSENGGAPFAKAQVVGWPPIRSFRKNTMSSNLTKNSEEAEGKSGSGCLYIKVSMEGAPYLRKVDLKLYRNYSELSLALEKMFSCFTIGQCGTEGLPTKERLSESTLKDFLHSSEYVLTFEDKDGDWMLVGDVPWEMFTDSCRRLRIMKGSEAIGLAPRATEKCKNRN